MGDIDRASVKNIVVIRLDRVGDLILSTPFLRNLRFFFPQSRIFAVVTPYTEDVLRDNPRVDEILVYDSRWSSVKKSEFHSRLSRIKSDIAIALSPTADSYLMAYGTGALHRYGYVYSGRWISRIFTRVLLSRTIVLRIDELLRAKRRIPHEVEQTFSILKEMGCEAQQYSLELYPGEGAREYAHELIDNWASGRDVVGVHLSAKWVSGTWSEGDFYALIKGVLGQKVESCVLVTFGEMERELAEKIKPGLIDEKRVALVGPESFRNWASLIGCCRLFLSTDTGSLHCAAAMGVPVVCIYEDKTFEHCSQQWSPWKVRNMMVRKGEPGRNIREILEGSKKLNW